MRTRRGRGRRRSRPTISLVLLVVLLCVAGVVTGNGSAADPSPGPGAAGLAAPARAVPHAPTPPGGANGPRIAYTSDSDQIVDQRGNVLGTGTAPLHEGERSADGSSAYSTFVSTSGGTQGEVFLQQGTDTPVAITCDGLIHTHPVVISGGTYNLPPGLPPVNPGQVVVLVAYGVQVGGTSSIEVAVANLGFSPTTFDCADFTKVRLAGQTGSNYWPVWGPGFGPAGGGSGNETPSLIYTSTRDNPLGDLYAQNFGSATAARITDGGTGAAATVANTRPSYGRGSSVLFTTTAYRSDGSLGSTVLMYDTNGTSVAGSTGTHSAWVGTPVPQSSAGVVQGSTLLYTSNDLGSQGVIREVDGVTFDPTNGVQVSSNAATVTRSGRYPTRSVDDAGLGAAPNDLISYTRDSLAGGIGGVLASDPTSAADLERSGADASTPTYSPDGARIAYSQALAQVNGVVPRGIYLAKADGSSPTPLGEPSGPGEADIDIQPAFSPDGTHLAFTRIAYTFSNQQIPIQGRVGIMIADLTVSPPTVRYVDTPSYQQYQDVHASWSPDGSRLVIARAPLTDLTTGVTMPAGYTQQQPIPQSTNFDFTVAVANQGAATTQGTTVTITFTRQNPNTAAAYSAAVTPITYPASCVKSAASVVPVTLTCTVADVPNGGNRSITITAQTGNSSTSPSLAHVDVTASNDSSESDVANNDSSGTIWVAAANNGPKIARSGSPRARIAPRALAANGPAPTGVGTPVPNWIRGVTAFLANTPSQLWVVEAGTGNGGPLGPAGASCNATGCGYYGRSPAWSPDGTHIAYEADGTIQDVSLTDTDGNGVADVPAVATGQRAVTGFKADGTPTDSRSQIEAAYDPAWWPDGSALVFTGQPAGLPMQHGIYIVNTDGTGLRTIVQGRGPESEPAVQPQVDLGVTLTSTPTDPGSAPTSPAGDATDIYTRQSTTLTATITNPGISPVAAPVVTFTIPAGTSVQNPPVGCVPATAVTGPGTLTCTAAALAFGDSTTVVIVATADDTSGSRTFTASVASPADTDTANDTASATVIVRPRADLDVTITANPLTVQTGSPTTITATVVNNGPGAADDTTMTITVPDGVDPPTALTPSGGTAPTCAFTSGPAPLRGTITCQLGTIAAKGSQTVSFKASSDDADVYPFTATVDTSTAQADDSGLSDTVRVRVTAHAGLSVVIDASPTTIALGEQTAVTATVTNLGPDTAGAPEPSPTPSEGSGQYVTLTITLPAGMSVPAPPTGCTIVGTTMTCELVSLAAGASRAITFDATGQVLGDHDYDASASSDTPDDDPSDNTDSVTVSVVRRIADLTVTITPSQSSVTPGTAFNAVVTVRNDGPYEAQNSTLTATFDPRLQAVSSPACAGDGTTCALGTLAPGDNVSYIVTLNARSDGTPPKSYAATMSAKVATTSAESDTTNNSATASVRVTEKPAVADVAVQVNLPAVAYVGGTVRGTITVTNLGPQTASKVRLTTFVSNRLDAVAAPVCVLGGQVCELGSLTVGQTRVFSVRITPTRLEPARNYGASVAARVSTTTTESDKDNNRDSARLPVKQPRIRLLPPIGPPGFVTLVFGENLPPGKLVALHWRTGITSYGGPYRVDPDGTITAPMQVIRRDELGNRRMVLNGKPGLFAPVGATMLVVPARSSPPRFFGRG